MEQISPQSQPSVPPTSAQTVQVSTDVLAELIENQEMLAVNQRELLRVERGRRRMGIFKIILLVGATLVGWWYSQQLISSFFGAENSASTSHGSTFGELEQNLDVLKKQVEPHPFGVDQDVLRELGIDQ